MEDSNGRYFFRYAPIVALGDAITERFGPSHSPLRSLKEDDDRAFVVKMHGYVEIALNTLLAPYFNHPRLGGVLRKIDTAHEGRGKLAFVKAMDLLPADGSLFIKMLTKLRGQVVYDMKGIDLDLTKYFADLDPEAKEAWRNALVWWLKHADPLYKQSTIEFPRAAIFSCSMQIMAHFLASWASRASLGENLNGSCRN